MDIANNNNNNETSSTSSSSVTSTITSTTSAKHPQNTTTNLCHHHIPSSSPPHHYDDEESASQQYYIPLPDLHGKSDILEQQHIKELSKFLPARAEGYAWTLAFTTSHMGFSLKSLYRSLAKYEGPVLLIIKDSENVVFGAFSSCNLQQSDCFYGTGETYLFSFKTSKTTSPPSAPVATTRATSLFHRYNWSGDNLYFVKGNSDSIVFGAGDGNYGLWLDEDLYHGTSNSCKTFNNDPLTNHEDFVVCALECWCFI